MRLFLFKIFFRLTWWLAPDRARVNQMCDIYLKLLETERQKDICEKRQAEMDKYIRPRTETYEQHTISDQGSRKRYTDYDEATKYHNKGK